MATNARDVSVLICTHNRADDLRETLEECARVIEQASVSAEIIVCANGCTDDTASVLNAARCLFRSSRLVCLQQRTAGKSAAFVEGVLASSGEVLLVLDDDNTLLPKWIELALEILSNDPSVGIVGCASRLPSTTPVHEGTRPFLSHYAVGSQRSIVGANGNVWGAGMVIWARPLRHWFRAGGRLLLAGRVGGNLVAGEDTEICYIYRRWGYTTHCVDFDGIVHRIASNRFDRPHLRRLWRSEGAAYQIYRNYDEAVCLFTAARPRYCKIVSETLRLLVVICIAWAMEKLADQSKWAKRFESNMGQIIGIVALMRRRKVITEGLAKFSLWNPTK